MPEGGGLRARISGALSRWTLKDWLGSAFALVVVDQIVKVLALQSLSSGQVVEVTPFFNLVLVYNPGAAFSFLAGASGWQREFFVGVALLASGWITWMLSRHCGRILFCVALTLVLGGAIGNLIDRLWLGAVIDFLDFHVLGYHWPAFNVADSAISIGAVLLVWDAFQPEPQEPSGQSREVARPGEAIIDDQTRRSP
ncbi:MAG: signal peptidase II [Pseudomonadota bacterium]